MSIIADTAILINKATAKKRWSYKNKWNKNEDTIGIL